MVKNNQTLTTLIKGSLAGGIGLAVLYFTWTSLTVTPVAQAAPADYPNASKAIGVMENGVFVPRSEFIAGQEAVVRLVIKGAASENTNRPPLDVSLIMDKSGSMGRRFSGPYDYTNARRIDVAKDSLRAFVDQADATKDRIGLGVFSSGSDGQELLSGLTGDFNYLRQQIDSIDEGGGTSLGYGLKLGNSILDTGVRPGTIRAIIFATDGQQKSDEDVFTNGSLQRAKDAGYVIFTVGISQESVGNEEMEGEPWNCPVDNSLVDTGAEYLQCMSRYTGGKYYLADKPEDLSDIYTNIISNELLNLKASFEDFINTQYLTNPQMLKVTDLNNNTVSQTISVSGDKISGDFGVFGDGEGRVIYIKAQVNGGTSGTSWTTTADQTPDSKNKIIYRKTEDNTVASETQFSPNPQIRIRLPRAATVNGTVYNDLNRNCTRDGSEPILTTASIKLRQLSPSSCAYDKTKTPNSSGNYSFNDLTCFSVTNNSISTANYRLTLTSTDPLYTESCGRAFNVNNLSEGETVTVNLGLSKLADPWYQSFVGSIFANGGINSKIPETAVSKDLIISDATHAPGVAMGNPINLDPAGRISSTNWRAAPQPDSANIPTLRLNELKSYLLQFVDKNNYTGTPPTAADATPASDSVAVYYAPGNVTLNTNGGNWQDINYPVIIIADGGVTIPTSLMQNNRAISLGQKGFLLITAGKDINIESGVGTDTNSSTDPQLEGVFVAGRSMFANQGGTGDRTIDKRLNIAGTVVVGTNEAGTYISNRTHEDNDLYPADYFIYNGKLVLNAPKILTSPLYNWQEIE